ncbi:MAG: GAF domain-containing protein [Alphaproteobacteria bacterium]|nr:GAF domain-containing protein [Alphaproteobacteria bacterium]
MNHANQNRRRNPGRTSSVDSFEHDRLRRLIDLGIALSAERNHDRLLEQILLEAKSLTNADGGTLYLMDESGGLCFEIVHNDKLAIAMGGTTGRPVPFPPLRLYDPETGQPNHHNVATHAALSNSVITIEDAYNAKDFDFSGTKKFDASTGYRSKSFLTVPLRNYHGDVIGVLQLINARDDEGAVSVFTDEIVPLITALASQAAIAIDNQRLIEAQKKLLESFIQVIAHAIDAKSPYTGGHCVRVPVITEMLVKAAHDSRDPAFADFHLSEDQFYELHLAAWLHDCGKVTTPEYVVDKSTKLETIYDRIHEIRTRFEVLRRDAEIAFLRDCQAGGDVSELQARFDARCRELQEQYAFVAESNLGSEFFGPDKVARLKEIGAQTWTRYFDRTTGLAWTESTRCKDVPPPPATERLLEDRPDQITDRFNLGELYNLSIGRGTLTAEERRIINDHIVVTIDMLNKLPLPKHLRSLPEIAGAHHEKMDGTGYPRGLKRAEMSVPARAMAIADIFEALTAADRPYKKPKTLSESIKIMSNMNKSQHIDPDLFDLFLRDGVFKEYATKFLLPEQIDDFDITPYFSKMEVVEQQQHV